MVLITEILKYDYIDYPSGGFSAKGETSPASAGGNLCNQFCNPLIREGWFFQQSQF